MIYPPIFYPPAFGKKEEKKKKDLTCILLEKFHHNLLQSVNGQVDHPICIPRPREVLTLQVYEYTL
jgi:hypothetical protein